jgi:ABC-type proline/glycine betaine transport system permease subunit
MSFLDEDVIPKIPIGEWFSDLVDWVQNHLQALLDFISTILQSLNDWLSTGLNAVPALVMVVILAALALVLRGWQLAVFTIIGMLIIQSMRFWKDAMDTLALVIVSGAIAMIIAIPLGILAARSGVASKVIKPIMDFMQTLPAFVYLLPALFFFSVGVVPGIIATIIFSMPPGVRLTELGIRQVDQEMVEAGEAFGTAPTSVLTRIQIPLAMPTIMAGVNQVIMLSLSMVVIAGMVGAGGLGAPIYGAITQLNVGKGFAGGLAVVILAIFLDRLSAGLGDRSAVARANRATAKAGR